MLENWLLEEANNAGLTPPKALEYQVLEEPNAPKLSPSTLKIDRLNYFQLCQHPMEVVRHEGEQCNTKHRTTKLGQVNRFFTYFLTTTTCNTSCQT